MPLTKKRLISKLKNFSRALSTAAPTGNKVPKQNNFVSVPKETIDNIIDHGCRELLWDLTVPELRAVARQNIPRINLQGSRRKDEIIASIAAALDLS